MNKLLKFVSVFKLKSCLVGTTKQFTTTSRLNVKVVVCGSSGGVGQPLSLLLKLSPHISDLTLFDVNDCEGVAADLEHVNTSAKLSHFGKSSLILDALDKKDIIVVTAGKAREKDDKDAELLTHNANIIRDIAGAMTKAAPGAILCIVTNPLNSLMPVAAETLKKAKVFNPRRLFGVTTLDSVRASTFAANLMCYDPVKLVVPVIGGHSSTTIVPVFSQSSKPLKLPKDQMNSLIEQVQNAATSVLKSKKGKQTATLSTAYATARFVFALCRALKGENNIVECAMVQSDLTDAEFFATPLLLGPLGMKKNLGYGKLNKDECCLVTSAVKELVKDINEGKKLMEGDKKNGKK